VRNIPLGKYVNRHPRGAECEVIEGELLLPMRRVSGVIEVEHNGGRWRGVTGNKVLHQRLRQAIQVLAVDAVFQAGECGATRQVLRGLQGRPLDPELAQGVVPKALGIIAVGIPRGNLVDTLGEEVPQGVVDIRRMALVPHGSRKACGQATLAVDAAQ
jgi:hypothetical protein